MPDLILKFWYRWECLDYYSECKGNWELPFARSKHYEKDLMDIGNIISSYNQMWKMLAEIIMISHEIAMSYSLIACEIPGKMDFPRDYATEKGITQGTK